MNNKLPWGLFSIKVLLLEYLVKFVSFEVLIFITCLQYFKILFSFSKNQENSSIDLRN